MWSVIGGHTPHSKLIAELDRPWGEENPLTRWLRNSKSGCESLLQERVAPFGPPLPQDSVSAPGVA